MPFVGHKIEATSDDFGKMVRNNCLLVDKTLMIREFLEGQEVSLLTRPRRFGKTLNMSMLQHFFASEVAGQPTTGLFDAFAIAREDGGRWMEYQSQYPVIFITFKDVKESSYADTISSIKELVVELYQEHKLNLLSERLDENDKNKFQKYLEGNVNSQELEKSLRFLSEFLFKVSEKKAIILIDEYDTPLTNAYQHGFLDEISGFMRNMFSAALKGNAYLEKGLVTGILRVSKNELLSGLNNLRVYTLLDEKYNQYFGFTESEVVELATHVGIDRHLGEIKRFYNGYRMGEMVIYNPWSLMNYVDEKRLIPYWVLTSGDKLLKDLFLRSDADQKDQFSELMKGNIISVAVSLQTRYEELIEEPDALWTLLLFSGYLTSVNSLQERSHLICELKIPNEEILSQYQDIFSIL